MVLVFDFRLGERGFKGNGPVNWLFAAVDQASFDEGGKGAHHIGLKGGGLGLVLVLPVGEDADALELGGLLGDPALGKLVAFRAQFGGRDRLFQFLQFAGDLLLDGQAVAVPAGHVGRAETAHGFVAVDDVLERLVQGRADMDVAVRERWAVMQDEGRGAGPFALDGVVEIGFFPVGHPGRLALHQIRPHGEIGFGKQEGVFQVLRHSE